jgi:hypothetical protein
MVTAGWLWNTGKGGAEFFAFTERRARRSSRCVRRQTRRIVLGPRSDGYALAMLPHGPTALRQGRSTSLDAGLALKPVVTASGIHVDEHRLAF